MSKSLDVDEIRAEVLAAYGAGSERIDGPDLEAYCGQVSRLRDAQARIAEEGLIVADAKGVPMPHPALLIERQAQDEIRKWGSAFRPARGRR